MLTQEPPQQPSNASQVLDIIYKNYGDNNWQVDVNGYAYLEPTQLTKEEFINKIKTDDKFAKKQHTTIAERELSFDEKVGYARSLYGKEDWWNINDKRVIEILQSNKREISITYKGQTIKNYE